jgi:hypothetical protein
MVAKHTEDWKQRATRAKPLTVAKSSTYKFPKTPGACVDKLYALDQKQTEAQRVADDIKREFAALEAHLIATLPKSDLDGAIGAVAMAKLRRTLVPNITDWRELYAYVKKNNAWDLIQKRASAPAFRERWADKKIIPGAEPFTKISLSLTKRGA